jgi:hypothetical protein
MIKESLLSMFADQDHVGLDLHLAMPNGSEPDPTLKLEPAQKI